MSAAAARAGPAAATELWTGPMLAMYRVRMNEAVRDEIAAAAGAHRELGPGYSDAVAQSLVDRIGAEIDRRVDARLASRSPSQPARASSPWVPIVLGLGSLTAGVAATGAVLYSNVQVTAANLEGGSVSGGVSNSVSGSQVMLLALIWLVIAAVNVGYALFWSRRG